MNLERLEPLLYLPDDTSFFPEHGDDRHLGRLLWRAAGLMTLVLAVYLPVLIWGGLVWQDEARVVDNVLLWSWSGLAGVWAHPIAGAYRPVGQTLFWIEHHFFQTTTHFYHFISVVLHGANAIVLWMVLRRLNVRGAWLAAALFGVHPVQVQAVSWISQQPHLLAAGLELGAIWAFLRLNRIYPPLPEEFTLAAGDDIEDFLPLEPARRLYALTLGLGLLAALSDPLGLPLPLVLGAILWWKKGRITRDQWLQLAPLIVIAGVATAIAIRSGWGVPLPGGAGATLSLLQRFDVAGRAVWTYALRIAWPSPLLFVYPRWAVPGWQVLFPAGLVLAGGMLWMRRGTRGRGPFAALLIFVVLLLPALGVVLGSVQPPIYVADHLQYLAAAVPLVVVAAAGMGLFSFAPSVLMARSLRAAAGIACCLGLGFLAWRQGSIYEGEALAWQDTLANDPNSSVALTQYAQFLLAHGKEGEAADLLRDVQVADSDDVALLQSRGQLYLAQSRFAEAVSCYQRAQRIEPDNHAIATSLAVAYAKDGRVADAISVFDDELSRHGNDPATQTTYGDLLLSIGKVPEAIEHLRAALQSDPRYVPAKTSLAVAYFQAGMQAAAAEQLQQSVAIDPKNFKAYMDAGVMLGQLRDFADAEDMFKMAVRLQPASAESWNNLGMVQAAQGKTRLGDAVWNFDHAVRLKPDFEAAQRNLDRARRELASSDP